jgi:hypothetical protein
MAGLPKPTVASDSFVSHPLSQKGCLHGSIFYFQKTMCGFVFFAALAQKRHSRKDVKRVKSSPHFPLTNLTSP